MNSINVDWSEEVDNSNWDFISHNFLTSGRSCPKCYEPLEEKTKHMMGDETAMSEELVYHCGDCNKDFENSKEQQQKHAQSIVNFIGEYYTEYLKDFPRSVTLRC